MARFKANVESAVALAAGANICNLAAGAAAGYFLRRLKVGVRAGATVPTSQQMTLAFFRATARGTSTATTTGANMNPRLAASAITGLDTAWSVNPTLAGAPIDKLPSFNTQSGLDLPWEALEEFFCDQGAANGLCLQNIGNALPGSHLYTVDLEWEE